MNGYFAIQLDKQSQNVVSKNATMPVMVSDHITLAYKPVKKVYDKYSKLIGKKVGAFIKGYRSNKNIATKNFISKSVDGIVDGVSRLKQLGTLRSLAQSFMARYSTSKAS